MPGHEGTPNGRSRAAGYIRVSQERNVDRHGLGRDERGACRWSINLFRRVFPEQYARLQADGHVLRSTSGRR